MRLMRVLYDGAAAPAAAPNPLAGAPPAADAGQPNPGGQAPAGAGATQQAAWPDTFDFKAFLPADVKDHQSFAKITSGGKDGFEALARGFVHAQTMVGRDPSRLVEIPEKVDPAQRKDLLTKMGLPKDPSGYKLEAIAEAPPWLSPTDPLATKFVATAAEVGIFPDQAQAIYKMFAGEMTTAAKAQHAQTTAADAAAVDALRKEWGGEFDNRVRAANFAIEKLGGSDLRGALNEAGLGAHPAVVKALAQVGAMMAEAGGGGDKGAASFGNGLAPNELKAKAQEMLNQALNEKDQFKKAKLNEEAQKLFAAAAGGRKV